MFKTNRLLSDSSPLFAAGCGKRPQTPKHCGRFSHRPSQRSGLSFCVSWRNWKCRGVASRRIAGNGADGLARFDVLSRAHRSTCQVTVDRDVSAVANEDIAESAHGENGRHVPFIHRTRLGGAAQERLMPLLSRVTPRKPVTLYEP